MKTDIDGRVQPDGVPVDSLRAGGRAGGGGPRRDHEFWPRPGATARGLARNPGSRRPHRPRGMSPHADAPLLWPPPADALRPMLSTGSTRERAKLAARQWGDPVWAEAKWDGIRAVGVWDGSRLRLVARSGNDITFKYPEVTEVDVGPRRRAGDRRRRDRRDRRARSAELSAAADPDEPAASGGDRPRGEAHAGAVLPVRRPRSARSRCHRPDRCGNAGGSSRSSPRPRPLRWSCRPSSTTWTAL